jgi:hypothetical protein
MNIEIAFRAWDKQTGEMFEVHELYFVDNSNTFGKGILDEHNDFHPMDEIELMQFTGLLDKNGKKIFEGDIVRRMKEKPDKFHFEIYDPNPLISEIFYDKACFFVRGIADMNFYIGAVHEKIEVIGNIYENPELLEADAEI